MGMSTKHFFFSITLPVQKSWWVQSYDKITVIDGILFIVYSVFLFGAGAGWGLVWAWVLWGFGFAFQKSGGGSRHWNEGEITLSLEELLSLLSRHTSDYKVQLARKTQNAAGNLQVIKRLRRSTEKNGADKWC